MQNAHTTALHAAKRRLCCHKQSLDPERVTEVGFRTPGILREVWRLLSDAVTVTFSFGVVRSKLGTDSMLHAMLHGQNQRCCVKSGREELDAR